MAGHYEKHLGCEDCEDGFTVEYDGPCKGIRRCGYCNPYFDPAVTSRQVVTRVCSDCRGTGWERQITLPDTRCSTCGGYGLVPANRRQYC